MYASAEYPLCVCTCSMPRLVSAHCLHPTNNTHVYMCIYVCTCMYSMVSNTYIHTCLHASIDVLCMCVYIYVCIHTYTYARDPSMQPNTSFIYADKYACTQLFSSKSLLSDDVHSIVQTVVLIHTYICMHTHTHTHTRMISPTILHAYVSIHTYIDT